MQTAATEGEGLILEALMNMRKVEACRSSGGGERWTCELKSLLVWKGVLVKEATDDFGI